MRATPPFEDYMAIKVREAKMAVKSILHTLCGLDAALSCLVEDFNCNENMLKSYQRAVNNEFERLFAGKPSIIEENYSKTRKI